MDKSNAFTPGRCAVDADTGHAVQIAERIWWVGHHIPDDQFQCHVYLIENGDDSVLIDPGSVLTFKHTLRKIEEVVPFSKIRYFVCHHQDPDITGALNLIDSMVSREDARLVTHWRAEALLKHYGLDMKFLRVEDHDWKLDIGGRTLEFHFTPYMHFAGAFCTLDTETGTLFSSDIFGGFTKRWSLYARDESYFEDIRPFHEHYIPGRDVLLHTLLNLEKLPIKMIAPQHGSIIPEKLVEFMMSKLKGLDCGLYLIARKDTDIHRLMKLDELIRESMRAMLLYRDFTDVAKRLLELATSILPVDALEFYVLGPDDELSVLAPDNHYRGEAIDMPEFIQRLFKQEESCGPHERKVHYEYFMLERNGLEMPAIAVPLRSLDDKRLLGAAVFLLFSSQAITRGMNEVLAQLSIPLSVAIERENLYRRLESERTEIYKRSIRDTLTGLYTRVYMEDAVQRLIDIHDRDTAASLVLVMFDIDHFKKINDTYGHDVGDRVLKKVAETILNESRKDSIPVRFGGEEISLFAPAYDLIEGEKLAERLRSSIEDIAFTEDDKTFTVTVSAGVALHRQNEELASLIKRADTALYEAKRAGRNRFRVAA